MSAEQTDRLWDVNVVWADLPGNVLGVASASTNYVWIDRDAAGYGWSLTRAAPGAGKVDLLSTVAHELGHMLGFDHDLLGDSLGLSERNLLTLAGRPAPGGEFGPPLVSATRPLFVTSSPLADSARGRCTDAGPGRGSSHGAVESVDQAWAEWATAAESSASPAAISTVDQDRRATEEHRRKAERSLDDDLLTQLARALTS